MAKEDSMKCPECKGKMIADNGKYGEKIPNSTLYVCTGPACGRTTRKNRNAPLPKRHKPLQNQPLLPM